MSSFADNLKTLPSIENIAAISLCGADGAEVARIENRAGSQGSLAVYAHLLAVHGQIHIQAAQEGLMLYAEHTQDARNNPGKHPNIDRLMAIVASGAALTGHVQAKG